MRMRMNLFYGNGYEIAKPVPTPPRCHPYPQLFSLPLLLSHILVFSHICNCEVGTSPTSVTSFLQVSSYRFLFSHILILFTYYIDLLYR